jgi:hypothetical protein
MAKIQTIKCECGNTAEAGESTCEWCTEDGEQHVGHVVRFSGTWYCDTCDSPYCDLA